jgi:hypothetical protein
MGKRRIPDLRILRREARALNRRMNRDRVKINWKFDRKTARRKFSYKGPLSCGQRPSFPSIFSGSSEWMLPERKSPSASGAVLFLFAD